MPQNHLIPVASTREVAGVWQSAWSRCVGVNLPSPLPDRVTVTVSSSTYSIFPSIRVFSSESVFHIRWLKYWGFSFSITLSNQYSGLISFSIHWFDHLAVQETLKRLLRHNSSKASILQCSAFLMVQLSHLYMTTEKTVALTTCMFVGKMISLLFNMLSR